MKCLVGILSFVWLLGAGVTRADKRPYNKDIAHILWQNCTGVTDPARLAHSR